MLCDICKKNPATIHIQEITGNQKKTLHLCQECATKKAQEDSTFQAFNLAEVLYNISSQITGNPEESKSVDTTPSRYDKIYCPICGWDYDGFRKTGRLGCPDCYSAFYDVLKNAIGAMHRGTVHLGKKPVKCSPVPKRKKHLTRTMLKNDISRLQQDLDASVQQERYEDAAVIRDKINDLKQKLEAMDHGKQA